MTKQITILGAGSWGTALSILLSKKGFQIILWARDPQLTNQIKAERENKKYLPNITLPNNVNITSSLKEAINNSELIVLAIPSIGLRQVISQAAPFLKPQMLILNAGKGLEAQTGLRHSQVILDTISQDFQNHLAVLSGPNLAIEVAKGIPTTTVIASTSRNVALYLQDIFNSPTFRVYTNPDVIGVELGGALKNIIAIGAGISDGLGFGDNTKAALLTRGLTEIIRLGTALGAQPATFSGLSGIGDLAATCASRHSRNWYVGYQLAQGKPLKSVINKMTMIAEGVPTTQAAYKLATENHVEMPITAELYQVLFQNKPPKTAVTDLMLRQSKDEIDVSP